MNQSPREIALSIHEVQQLTDAVEATRKALAHIWEIWELPTIHLREQDARIAKWHEGVVTGFTNSRLSRSAISKLTVDEIEALNLRGAGMLFDELCYANKAYKEAHSMGSDIVVNDRKES